MDNDTFYIKVGDKYVNYDEYCNVFVDDIARASKFKMTRSGCIYDAKNSHAWAWDAMVDETKKNKILRLDGTRSRHPSFIDKQTFCAEYVSSSKPLLK
jgi:hypothetical protein